MWQEETQKTETSLKQHSMFDDEVNKNIPPVRGSNFSVPISQVKILCWNISMYIYVYIYKKNTKN